MLRADGRAFLYREIEATAKPNYAVLDLYAVRAVAALLVGFAFAWFMRG